MDFDQLVVLGNGFDLAHQVPTSYGDFIEYLSVYDPDLYKAMIDYYDRDELWCNMEVALAYPDLDKLQDHASQFYADLSEGNYGINKYGDYNYEVDKVVELITIRMRRRFKQWILSIYNEIEKAPRKFDLEEDSLYLNFNYTPTLQQLYQIPDSNIVHVHGRVYHEDSAIILGHAISPEKWNEKNPLLEDSKGDEDSRINTARQAFLRVYQEHYKDVQEIIESHQSLFDNLENISKIKIIGHSLSDIDRRYFEMLASKVNPNVAWLVGYHRNGDDLSFAHFIKRLGIKDRNLSIVPVKDLYIRQSDFK